EVFVEAAYFEHQVSGDRKVAAVEIPQLELIAGPGQHFEVPVEFRADVLHHGRAVRLYPDGHGTKHSDPVSAMVGPQMLVQEARDWLHIIVEKHEELPLRPMNGGVAGRCTPAVVLVVCNQTVWQVEARDHLEGAVRRSVDPHDDLECFRRKGLSRQEKQRMSQQTAALIRGNDDADSVRFAHGTSSKLNVPV